MHLDIAWYNYIDNVRSFYYYFLLLRFLTDYFDCCNSNQYNVTLMWSGTSRYISTVCSPALIIISYIYILIIALQMYNYFILPLKN